MHLLPKTELLNETIFYDLGHARDILARWSMGYNQKPPHSALGYLTPAAFARTFTATLDRLRSYADRPLLRRRPCANLSPKLWLQINERRGSQQIRLGIRRRLEKPLALSAAPPTDRNPHINTNVATLRTKS